MAKRVISLVPIPEMQVRRLASIVGERSAAAAALKDHKRRQDAGEEVRFFYDQQNGAIVVAGRIQDAETEQTSNRIS